MGIGFDRHVVFIFLLPIWILLRVFVLLFRQRNKTGVSSSREVLVNIFFIYILCVLALTLFPLQINWDNGRQNWFSVNLIPVYATVNEVINITDNANMHNFMVKFWIRNIGGNILLLLPLGLMLPMLWRTFESRKKTILFGFCFSLGIEVIQLLSGFIGNAGRAFDVDDIILNTIGVCIGVILFSWSIKAVPGFIKLKQQ